MTHVLLTVILLAVIIGFALLLNEAKDIKVMVLESRKRYVQGEAQVLHNQSFIIKITTMANEKLDAVNTALDTLGGSVNKLQADFATEIQSLKDQIAAGNPVTDTDLDNLLAKVNTIKVDVESTKLDGSSEA